MLRVVIALLIALLLLQIGEPLAGARVTSAKIKRALKHFRQGESHYGQGRYKRALRHYQRALRFARRPSLYFNIAQCYRFLDQPEAAIAHYEQYLSKWRAAHRGSPPPNEEEVQEFIDELRLKLGGQQQGQDSDEPPVRPTDPPATVPAVLYLSGLPPGAVLSVDGKLTEVGPDFQLKLEPGRHELLVDAPGRRPWSEVIELRPGQRGRIVIELPPLATRRSLFWLVTGISATALALGSEAAALVFTHKTNQEYTGSDRYNTFRSVAIAGHATAGACAILSAVSTYLFWRSGKPARVALQPGSGNGVLSASFAF